MNPEAKDLGLEARARGSKAVAGVAVVAAVVAQVVVHRSTPSSQ